MPTHLDGSTGYQPTRALVVHPASERADGRHPQSRLEEGVRLAEAIGLEVAHADFVALRRPQPATLFGRGVVDRFGELIRALEIGVAVVDGALTPIQQRNLERAWRCKVIDRTGLILEIFGARARTREGQQQVELAALSYQRSRLVRSWTHLERQRGGFGFLGGPGESQLEIDRRLIGNRIAKLRRELEGVKRTRALHRDARRRVPYPVVALVGYTNAGKSTLFNRLTAADVGTEDMVFATLDPTMRAFTLPDGARAILSDTVGFISNLPTDLIAAFRATLEEVRSADLIVHVRDASHPEMAAQKADVEAILDDLDVADDGGDDPLEVLNKIDRLDAEALDRLRRRARRHGDAVVASAKSGEGCSLLLERIAARLSSGMRTAELAVPLCDGAALAWLYRRGDVLERRDDDSVARLRVRLDPADLARFRRRSERRTP